MTNAILNPVVHRLRSLATSELTDRQLLERFAAGQEEQAFALLVRRHGPLVLGVCRRLLRHEQDAEDAFQATFLVLARKASGLGWQESVGGWLYQVASRIAWKARAAGMRRRVLEREVQAMRVAEPEDALEGGERRALLDEELRLLPEKYRAPVVLCYLEGKSHAEAARQLGWPAGTVKGRLARARQRLRSRLARRGLVLGTALLAPLLGEQLAPAAVPARLAASALGAAPDFAAGTGTGGFASAQAVALAEAMLHLLAAGRGRLLALLVALALFGIGTGLLTADWREHRTAPVLEAGDELAAQHDRGSPAGPRPRLDDLRERLLERAGGNARSEAAVAAGLDWLARHQAGDGHWSLDHFDADGHCDCTGPGQKNDTAGTAFGLLSFLGAGITPRTVGPAAQARAVERGLAYLVRKETKEGDFGDGMYAHALATMALCEAYGLTADPALKEPAQRAVDYIIRAQNPKLGGWRYQPRTDSDTSVTGWHVQALVRAELAGLHVPEQTLEGATHWLDSCESPEGGYGYVAPKASLTMTAVGLLCRQDLGWGKRPARFEQAVAFLEERPPGGVGNLYHFYYATLVMSNLGGPHWDRWNPRMRDWLIETQDRGMNLGHGHQTGSWSPVGDTFGQAGGRLMITALALRTLEVYYHTDLLLACRSLPKLKPEELRRRWADLESADVPRARRGLWDLVATPDEAVPFLADQLRPADVTVDRRRLEQAAAELDDDRFAVRQKAATDLEKAGELAEPVLRKLLKGKPSPEARRRAEDLLAASLNKAYLPGWQRTLRALEALELIGTPAARQVLERLAGGTPEARLTLEARASLTRLGRRDSEKP
jgi:RNA polymerase sigma factor (sigma-70 family)